MPNWCTNELTISGNAETLDEILEFCEGENGRLDFDKIIPYPEPYKQMDKEAPDWTLGQEARDAQMAIYKAKWGTTHDGYNSGGYEWCCKNWGTKWNASGVTLTDSPDDVCFSFDTAWSPPIQVIEKLASKFPTLNFELKYEERGLNFAGDIFLSEGKVSYHNEYPYHYGKENEEDEEDENGEYEDTESFEAYRLFHGK